MLKAFISHYEILLFPDEDCELLKLFHDDNIAIQKKIDALYSADNLALATKVSAERDVTLAVLVALEGL